MREVTQTVFAEFKRRYIDTRRCFMSDIRSLSDAEMYASSLPYVMEHGLYNEASVQIRKNSMISFMVYQLVNNLKTQVDFGFGVFDESGISDQGGIQKAIRDYLFSVCFAVSPGDSRGSRMFVDYVLMQYQDSVGVIDRAKYKVDIRHVAVLLGEDNLRSYWGQNRDIIKEQTGNLTGNLVTHGYSIDYQHELPHLFSALDEFSGSGASHPTEPEPPIGSN